MQNITIIAGTNRKGAVTTQLAQYYSKLLQQHNCATQLISLADLPVDFTATALYENQGKNKKFNELKVIMEGADKYIFIVPEYNGSFPGVLKAFIDGLTMPATFRHKKCALVGVSAGVQGGVLALSHLTDIFHYLGMVVYPLKPKIANVRAGMSSILGNKGYLELIEQQAKGIIAF